MAKTFEFTNNNYIKKYPQLFEDNLRKKLLEKFDVDAIDMKRFVSSADGRKLKKEAIPMFANVSITNRSIEMPLISDSFKLKKTVYEVLEAAHEATKNQLAQMRRAGIAPMETKSKTKKAVIKPLEFDTVQEQQLLKELKKNNRRMLDKHFSFIALQEFYYKYRDLDEKCRDFAKAITICDQAIEYYDTIGMIESVSEFEKRKEKLEMKLQK